MHKRVRVDDYTTNSRLLRITGRSGYETSTDLWIERTFGLKFKSDRDENEERGWHTSSDVLEDPYDFYTIDWSYDRANLHGTVDIELVKGGLNDSMENLKFKPVGCNNHYDCYPKTQRKILPYLIPYDRWGNVEFMTDYNRTIAMGVSNSDGTVPAMRWDPTHNGNFVTTFVADAHLREVNNAVNQNSIRNAGFCPLDVIEFGMLPDPTNAGSFVPFDDYPSLMPVYYDADEDRLGWNIAGTVVVKCAAHIFGGNYLGAADHYFLINRAGVGNEYDHDSWTAKFDLDGIAGRNTPTMLQWLEIPSDPGANASQAAQAQYIADLAVYNDRVAAFEAAHQADVYGVKNAAGDNIHYHAHLNKFEEFYPLKLWSQAFPGRHVNALSNIPNTWHGAAVNAFNELTLWLRVPRFSKGQKVNWSMHPGLARFNLWYKKEVDGDLNGDASVVLGGPLEELIPFQQYDLPTPWFEMAYTPDVDIRNMHIGTWSTQWVGVDNIIINGNPYPSVREPGSFTLDLPGDQNATLWTNMSNLPDDYELSFKLRGGPQIVGPFPNSAQQINGAQAAIDPNANREFYIRFLKRHALFVAQNNSHQIIFQWVHLSGVQDLGNGQMGFPNGEFPHGKPFTCNTQDLYPRGIHVQGWIENEACTRSLLMHHNQVNLAQLAQFYNGNVTEVPGSWGEGSRPLFCTLANVQEQYQRHEKENPLIADAYDDSDLFTKLNAMFSGDVYIEIPRLDDYRSVLVGQNKASFAIKEPLFSLESGMSTYGVNRIFNNRPWYSLLLQDIDLHFQATKVSKKIFSNGTTGLTIKDGGVDRNMTGVTMNILDIGTQPTTVTVRTRDGRDQRTKMLLQASYPYPFMRQYRGITKSGLGVEDVPEVTISIYSERGIPDWFFIYAERDLPDDIDYIPLGHPIVAGVDFFARTNKNRSLCSYMINKHELWQTTRRNSHPEADLSELLGEVGGVLIGSADLGTLEFDEFGSKDCFDYDVKITLDNEMDTNGDIDARAANPINVTVVAIYENGVYLKGGGTSLSFVEIKETNY